MSRTAGSSGTDAELGPVLHKARHGDNRAFADLVMRFDHGLRGLVYPLLRDRDLMDDVLQETYLRAHRSLHRFRGEAEFKTWLFRIAYNCCIDELRRRRRRAETLTAEPVDTAAPGLEPGERTVLAHALAAALTALPPASRAAVLLVDWYGLDYAEAAKILGVRRGTLASQLSRARPVLRAALEEGAANP